MWQYNYTPSSDELYHYGVLGMKWGKRMTRGRGGLGMYAGKKRQLAGDKRDLDTLNKGGHLSVGATKKRQAAYDKRDKAKLEKRIAKTEKKIAKKNESKEFKKDLKAYNKSRGVIDVYSNNQGQLLYKHRAKSVLDQVAMKKGKDYADRIVKKSIQNDRRKLGAFLTASAAATVGLAWLESKYGN